MAEECEREREGLEGEEEREDVLVCEICKEGLRDTYVVVAFVRKNMGSVASSNLCVRCFTKMMGNSWQVHTYVR